MVVYWVGLDLPQLWVEDMGQATSGSPSCPHAAEQWKPLNPEEKKRYDREFLLGFQFILASMQKPEGLPQITDVVLDKVGAALEIGAVWVVPRCGNLAPLCALSRQGRDLVLCSESCCSVCNEP